MIASLGIACITSRPHFLNCSTLAHNTNNTVQEEAAAKGFSFTLTYTNFTLAKKTLDALFFKFPTYTQ